MHLLGLGILVLFWIGAMVAVEVRGANRQLSVNGLAIAGRLTFGQRLLVVAPHPDDETLGCGGLIASAKRAGAEVFVVFMTNGDGFRVAAERRAKRLALGPEQYVQFGRQRQAEALAACQKLGLARRNLYFLGFPDKGLVPLWSTNWTLPYRSLYTRSDTCPYEVAFQPGRDYTGQEALKQLTEVIERVRPTTIFVTHPLDDHPDHYAAYAFTTAAVTRLQETSQARQPIRLLTYLVHRGRWPAPAKDQSGKTLAPPAAIASVGTGWEMVGLKAEDVKSKEAALRCYSTQTAILGRFMRNFICTNELFGSLKPEVVTRVSEGSIRVDGSFADWSRLPVQILDGSKDTATRVLREGADIRSLSVARDSRFFYVRLQTEKRISDGVRLLVQLRSVSPGTSGAVSLEFLAPRVVLPRGASFARNGSLFEARLPVGALGSSQDVWVGASTYYLGFNVDKTGYRPLVVKRAQASGNRSGT